MAAKRKTKSKKAIAAKKPASDPPPVAPTQATSAQRSPAGWEHERARSAANSAERSRKGRDIAGGMPAVVDPARKEACGTSFELFCRTYFASVFCLPWSADHRRAIALIERVTREGGLFAYAMPRGSGKTSLAEAAVQWSVYYGYRQFPVVIGSDESSALEVLESIKSELENNELLLADFPEVCYPVRCLEGIAHRANGQLFNGQRTQMEWTSDRIVLPTIPGSKAGGAIVAVTGITGRVRGMKFKRPDGRSARPDIVLVDDPQTDESAKSPSQCAQRVKILSGAVLGLAGPGKDIAGLMTLTVVEPEDMADEMLDRQRHPEWRGERTKLVYRFPWDPDPKWREGGEPAEELSARERARELWDNYRSIRAASMRAGGDGNQATDFYRANREAMDWRAEVAWPSRRKPNEESALQHAVNLLFDRGTAAFAAEYQNDPPKPEAAKTELLSAAEVAAKVGRYERLVVPEGMTRLTAFIDVQQYAVFYGVCGFAEDFSGGVLDYGTYPDQRREYFGYKDLPNPLKAASPEEAVQTALTALVDRLCTKVYRNPHGEEFKIGRLLIDSGWQKEVVWRFCRETAHRNVVLPSRGIGIGANGRPFNEYAPKRGERRGLQWRSTLTTDSPPQRVFFLNTNFYKSFVHERLKVGVGGPGCLTLFSAEPQAHRMFAEHLLAEQPVAVTAKGQTVVEWTLPPSKPDNHFFDCLVGCHAAAAEQGAALDQLKPVPTTIRKRVKLSELQRQKSP